MALVSSLSQKTGTSVTTAVLLTFYPYFQIVRKKSFWLGNDLATVLFSYYCVVIQRTDNWCKDKQNILS
jgi:hypothetical protein